jgi:hypothetical protein
VKSILIIEPDPKTREAFKYTIDKYFGLNVVVYEDPQAAIKGLIHNANYDFILVRDMFAGVNNIGVLVSFLKKSKINLTLGIVGSESFSYEREVLISPHSTWRQILKKLAELLKVKLSDEFELALTDFSSVPICYFYQISTSLNNCDVYIRKNYNGLINHEMIFESSLIFDRFDIENFYQTGIKKFYIKSHYFFDFIENSSNACFRNFLSNKLSQQESIQLCSDTYDIIRDRMARFGVDDLSKNLVQCLFDSMQNFITKNSMYQLFIMRKLDLPLSYGFQRVFYIALLAQRAFPKLSFMRAASLEKFLYFNLLHDISLYDDDFLKIHTEIDWELSKLPKDKLEYINKHSLKSAELASQIDFVPNGTAELIIEHHGNKLGIGFKNQLSISVSVLTMMMTVIEDIVIEILHASSVMDQNDLDNLFKKKATIYNKINYKETLIVLRDLIKPL